MHNNRLKIYTAMVLALPIIFMVCAVFISLSAQSSVPKNSHSFISWESSINTICDVLHEYPDTQSQLSEELETLHSNGTQYYILINGLDILQSDGYTIDDYTAISGDDLKGSGNIIVNNVNGAAYGYTFSGKAASKIIIKAYNTNYSTALPVKNGVNSFISRYKLQLSLFIGVLVLLLTYFAASLLLTRVTRSVKEPLQKIRTGFNKISSGDLGFAITINADDEFSDIYSEFNKMAAKLNYSMQENKRYEAERNALIVDISHDLRTPLTAINGYATGILDGVAQTQQQQKQYLSIIKSTSENMQELLDDFFLLSKLDTKLVKMDYHTVDIYEYLHEYLSEQEYSLNSQINIQFPDDNKNAVAKVSIDSSHFARVINNIVSNCSKYKRGQCANINITLKNVGEYVIISFADDGIGVKENELNSIFESMYRTDQARSNTQNGSGLGLSISKRIINQFGGQIWATTNAQKGLTINIKLKIANEVKNENGTNN